MKTRVLLAVLAVSVVSLFSTVSYAQGAPPPGSQKLDDDKGGEEQLSEKEMLGRSSSAVKKMKGVLTRILEILDEARKDKDVVKINCVNEKLTASKALLRIAEQADIGLQEAVVKKELETMRHEFEKVTIASQKIQTLKTEAEACTGNITWYPGETKVEVEEPKDVAKKDPTNIPRPNPQDSIVRPPKASPYL